MLLFVQLEFTHSIGIPAGTYAVDQADSLLVEVVTARAAAPRRRFGSGPEMRSDPGEVALVVATLVLAGEPRADATEASLQLARWKADRAIQRSLIERALRIINRGLRGYRAAALDPYVIEVMELDPRSVRLGFGRPGEIGAGRWLDAFAADLESPPVKPRSVEQLRIGEAVGAALAGPAPFFEAEELALRSLLDLQHERVRAAAAQARAAVEVLKDELRAFVTDPELEGVTAVQSVDPEVIEATAMHVLETAAAYRSEVFRAGHSTPASA